MQNMDLHSCKLIADVTVSKSDKVLLVKYTDNNKYDLQKGWFLPNDLLEFGEHPEDAVIRILKNQLGLENVKLTLGDVESFTGNDKSWHIVFHYKTNLNEDIDVVPEKEISETGWFELDSLPDAKEVAHHGWALFTIKTLLK